MPTQKGESNFKWGDSAVTYVSSKLYRGPANAPFKLQSNLEGQLNAMEALLRVRSGADADMESGFINPNDGLRIARAWANNAMKFGGGNCGEHAATAYIWLLEQHVVPIDWAKFTNKDHSFVIIGRSAIGGYMAKDVPLQPWFKDAVICDPYWKHTYYWGDVLRDYPPEYIASIHHQESVSITEWKNR